MTQFVTTGKDANWKLILSLSEKRAEIVSPHETNNRSDEGLDDTILASGDES